MRILNIVAYWPRETFVIRHIEALNEFSNVNIQIVTRTIKKKNELSASIENEPSIANHIKRISFLSTYRTPHYIRHIKPDVVHFHHYRHAKGLHHQLQKMKVPYTVSIRGTDITINPVTKSKADNELMCDILRGASRIHAVCDAFHSPIKALCPKHAPIETIRTCLELTDDLVPVEETDKPRFITVGRLHWVKGYHDLIRAMSFIPDAELYIVGEGEERAHLTYLIHQLQLGDRVHLLGKLAYEEFKPLLVKATAYVQSSLSEGFSNSLIEAMSLGKPVFVTPVGGTPEIIINGQNGIHIPVGDPKEMAKKLDLVRDVTLLRQVGKMAYETAHQEFSMQKHAEAFERFFLKAIEGLK